MTRQIREVDERHAENTKRRKVSCTSFRDTVLRKLGESGTCRLRRLPENDMVLAAGAGTHQSSESFSEPALGRLRSAVTESMWC